MNPLQLGQAVSQALDLILIEIRAIRAQNVRIQEILIAISKEAGEIETEKKD